MNKFRLFNLIGGGLLTGGSAAILTLNQKGIIKPKKRKAEKTMKAACCAASGVGVHMIFDGVIDAKWFPDGKYNNQINLLSNGDVCLSSINMKSGCDIYVLFSKEHVKEVGEAFIEFAETAIE